MTREAYTRLNQLLALPATGHEQDWDVELADATRLHEFVSLYQKGFLAEEEKQVLMGLIIASADEAVRRDGELPSEWSSIQDLLLRDRKLHEDALLCWGLPGEEDPDAMFYISPAVRAILA